MQESVSASEPRSTRSASYFFAKKPYRIALTGGPSAGKSTLITFIESTMNDVLCMPEVATTLLASGFPAPPPNNREQWQRSFQQAIAHGQIELELEGMRQAEEQSRRVIVYDRGMLDGAAYLLGGNEDSWPSDLERFTKVTGETLSDSLSRYDLVLHLPSSACYGAYNKASNLHRFENADEALLLERKTLYAWRNHPHRIIIDEPDKDKKVERASKLLSAISIQFDRT